MIKAVHLGCRAVLLMLASLATQVQAINDEFPGFVHFRNWAGPLNYLCMQERGVIVAAFVMCANHQIPFVSFQPATPLRLGEGGSA